MNNTFTYNNPVNWLNDAWSDFFLPPREISSAFLIVENNCEESDLIAWCFSGDVGLIVEFGVLLLLLVVGEGEGEEGEVDVEDSDFIWRRDGGGGGWGGRGGGVEEVEFKFCCCSKEEEEEDVSTLVLFDVCFGLGGLAGGLGGLGGGFDDSISSFTISTN